MNEKIENLLNEDRLFEPSEELKNNANATSEWFKNAQEDRLEYWKQQALNRITWFKEPTEVLDDSNAPFFNDLIAISMFACPEIIKTGISLFLDFICDNNSIPSLSPLSNLTSNIATSGNLLSISFKA